MQSKALEFLQIARGKPADSGLLHVVTVDATSPATFVFEGTQQAIDQDIFEVPAACQPLQQGDRFLVAPIAGGQRWGLLQRLNR